MEKNIQCRCLILGGCHDNGYATFLESFRSNQKICLLETTPPAADFRKLSFKRVYFPSVFRSEPVPSRPTLPPGFVQTQTAAPLYTPSTVSPTPVLNGANGRPSLPSPAPTPSPNMAPPPSLAASLVASKPEGQSNSYAAVGRAAAPLTINIASQKKTAAARPYYQLNKDDERVDVPLAKTDPNAVRSFEDRMYENGKNFCNRYYLMNGNCKSANCSFYHGERLSPAEMLVLRHKTRNLVCGGGHACRDIACNLGHHCSNPGSCYFGSNCRFADMHGMDIVSFREAQRKRPRFADYFLQKPTIKIYEDGTREVV